VPWPGRVEKRPLDPARLRRVGPKGFAWIDRRFLLDEWIERLDPQENLLYLLLPCAADRLGLSYYGDRRLSRSLKLCPEDLDRARGRLVERGLIAWRSPLYQVLDLSAPAPPSPTPGPSAAGEILRGLVLGRPEGP